jgi:hypothetical protein
MISTKPVSSNALASIRDTLDPDSNLTEESDVHQKKHTIPKISILAGRMISIKPVRENAFLSIRDNLDPYSNVIEESDLHSEKHFSHKISTDAGRMISTKPVPQNARHSIRDNLDPDSNVIEESDMHQEKHSSPTISIDAGRMTSTKSVQENARLSIRDNLNPDSNLTEESDLHKEKQESPKNATDAGILINSRCVSSNAFASIRSNFDAFSIEIDLIDLFLQTLSEEMNLIGEGSHSLLIKKRGSLICETHRIRPSATINRGQNSFVIFQKTWEIWDWDWDWDWDCEGRFVMKMENGNDRSPLQKAIQKVHHRFHHTFCTSYRNRNFFFFGRNNSTQYKSIPFNADIPITKIIPPQESFDQIASKSRHPDSIHISPPDNLFSVFFVLR